MQHPWGKIKYDKFPLSLLSCFFFTTKPKPKYTPESSKLGSYSSGQRALVSCVGFFFFLVLLGVLILLSLGWEHFFFFPLSLDAWVRSKHCWSTQILFTRWWIKQSKFSVSALPYKDVYKPKEQAQREKDRTCLRTQTHTLTYKHKHARYF